MKGKEKCELLKSIRRDIAEKNGIKLEIPECTHKGDCLGSCPRCEAEVKYLERQLDARKKLGIKPVLAGISAGIIGITASSCIPQPPKQLMGDVPVYTDPDTTSPDIAVQTADGLITLPEDLESIQIEGSLHTPDTDSFPGEVTDAQDTELYVLDGDIAFNPDDLILDGDIAFIPEDEPEIAGAMPLFEEELRTMGDLVLPIESSGESVIERTPVVTEAEESCIPETVGEDANEETVSSEETIPLEYPPNM